MWALAHIAAIAVVWSCAFVLILSCCRAATLGDACEIVEDEIECEALDGIDEIQEWLRERDPVDQ